MIFEIAIEQDEQTDNHAKCDTFTNFLADLCTGG